MIKRVSLFLSVMMWFFSVCCVSFPVSAQNGCDGNTAHTPAAPLREKVTEATCTEQGGYEEVTYCAICGKELHRVTLVQMPLGHHFTNGVMTKPATETEVGIMTFTCSRCGAFKQTAIPRIVVKRGWKKENGKWYYYTNNAVTKGWKKISGSWYLFSNTGAMLTGWQQSGGKWYYLNHSGAMQTGWLKIGGKWYLLNSSGAMLTGWQKSGGCWYYFHDGGDMVTGWKKLGGKWYYFNSSGAMRTASLKQGGKTYYFNSAGACTNP